MTNLEQLLKLEELLFQAEKEMGVYDNGAINPVL
jgi:hypothetical protein